MSDQDTMNRVMATVSFGSIVGSMAHVLPSIAAFIAIGWYMIQIYESHTVQKHLRLHNIRLIRYRRLKREERHADAAALTDA